MGPGDPLKPRASAATTGGRPRLGEHFSAVYTSGRTGYEKPHPQAFEPVIEHGGDTEAWMIGDSVAADIEGANRVGLKAILVRNSHPSIDRQADGLPGVFEYLG